MYERGLDIESGFAVDNHAKIRHQIIRCSLDSKNNYNTIHYSVTRPAIKDEPKAQHAENLLEIITNKSSLSKDKIKRKALNEYMLLVSDFRSVKNVGFTFNQNYKRPALTYDINFDNDYNFIDVNFRPTRAYIKEAITNEEAKARTKACHKDEELEAWHNFFKHQLVKQKPNRKMQNLGFDMVTCLTTEFLRTSLREFTVSNNNGCIYQINDYKSDNKKKIYGSTHEYNNDLKSYGDDLYRAVISATASRNTISCINIISVGEFLQNQENLFSPTFLNAVAGFRTLAAA